MNSADHSSSRFATLFILRHGPTDWNSDKRLQGRNDLSLSKSGYKLIHSWSIPSKFHHARWICSPLKRAVETAHLLQKTTYLDDKNTLLHQDNRLIEMNFGEWEGWRIKDLRKKYENFFTQEEARGLWMRPPNGESPYEVQQRLKPFLTEQAKQGGQAIIVCHKGIIRALYALATDWDMTTKPQNTLKEQTGHCFQAFENGTLKIKQLNISLISHTQS